ncbi:MAG: dihydropteroate synthase [Aminivibrio sp.]
MIVYPLPAQSREDLMDILRQIGADLRSIAYFEPKREMLSLYIPKADFRAAAYMKQELLARGGDAVVHRDVIACAAEESDVLLLGTPGQIRSLEKKLAALPCWGLPDIRAALGRTLAGMAKTSWTFEFAGGRSLPLGKNTAVMGILNLTADSFYEGSRVSGEEELLKRALAMVEGGAAVLDVGAESTRPGSESLPEEEELARLIPAIRLLRKEFPGVIISADTWKGAVARQAMDAGADIINDISGLAFDPDLAGAVAGSGAALVLSHIQGTPRDMQQNPTYEDTVRDILRYFDERLRHAEEAGIDRERIIIDPGIGFGKSYGDNLRILNGLEAFQIFGRPLLVGHSRKAFIGRALGLNTPEDRLEGTLALTAMCAMKGASMVRVHDVKENARVLAMVAAVGETGR